MRLPFGKMPALALVTCAAAVATWQVPSYVLAQGKQESRQKDGAAKDTDASALRPDEASVKRLDAVASPATTPPHGGAADQRPLPARKVQRPSAPSKLPAFTPEREAAALKFVSEHHAELQSLLNRLKSSNATAYEQAIRDLFRNSERLAAIQERGELKRYDLELESWKVESRIRLLAARLAVQRDNSQLEQQLREAVLRRVDLRLSRLEFERQQMAERRDKLSDQISKLDDQIVKARKFRERQADQSVEQLIKSVRKPGAAGSPGSSGAAGAKKSVPVKTNDPKKEAQ